MAFYNMIFILKEPYANWDAKNHKPISYKMKEDKMQTEEQNNYLSAKELVELGVNCIESTTSFKNSVSKPNEEVNFSSKGIGFKSLELSVLTCKSPETNSAFALNILHDVCINQKLPAAYFSFGSIDYENIFSHLIAIDSKILIGKIWCGMLSVNDLEKIKESSGKIHNRTFFVYHDEKLSVKKFVKAIRKIYNENKIKLLILDTNNLSSNDTEEIGSFLCEAKQLSRTLNIPVLLSIEEKSFKRVKKWLSKITSQIIFLSRNMNNQNLDSSLVECQIKIVRGKEKSVHKLIYNTCSRVVDLSE